MKISVVLSKWKINGAEALMMINSSGSDMHLNCRDLGKSWQLHLLSVYLTQTKWWRCSVKHKAKKDGFEYEEFQ